ncbi:MAG TPA: hypothetical protein VF516_45465 [Kofleriaceae bacterium]
MVREHEAHHDHVSDGKRDHEREREGHKTDHRADRDPQHDSEHRLDHGAEVFAIAHVQTRASTAQDVLALDQEAEQQAEDAALAPPAEGKVIDRPSRQPTGAITRQRRYMSGSTSSRFVFA